MRAWESCQNLILFAAVNPGEGEQQMHPSASVMLGYDSLIASLAEACPYFAGWTVSNPSYRVCRSRMHVVFAWAVLCKNCIAKTGANNSCIAPVPPILCASPAALQYNPCWCQGWLADSSIIGQKKSKLSQWEERTNIEIWVTRYRLQRICLLYYLRRLTVATTHSPAGSKVLFQ